MAKVCELSGKHVPAEGCNWVSVGRAAAGRYVAVGSAQGEAGAVPFQPPAFATLQQAIAASQSWAFHHDVGVIYVSH